MSVRVDVAVTSVCSLWFSSVCWLWGSVTPWLLKPLPPCCATVAGTTSHSLPVSLRIFRYCIPLLSLLYSPTHLLPPCFNHSLTHSLPPSLPRSFLLVPDSRCPTKWTQVSFPSTNRHFGECTAHDVSSADVCTQQVHKYHCILIVLPWVHNMNQLPEVLYEGSEINNNVLLS